MDIPIQEPSRNAELGKLHPAFRAIAYKLQEQLNDEGLPFRLFEGYRSRERQAWLYASGRTRPGPKVTKAGPGESYHQYGLAGDWVLFIDGKWSWDTSRENSEKWERLHAIGKGLGLEPLSWELPHLQLAGLNISDLKAGGLPSPEVRA